MKTLFITLFLLSCGYFVNAQTTTNNEYPEIGKPCPDFLLKDVQYYKKKEVTLKDFSGKWLILDCWSESCTACIASFPKNNKLEQEFSDKIQFLLIGYVGEYNPNSVRGLYEKCRKKFNLQLPVVYDSTFFNRFAIGGVPYIIIIDPSGIVRGITTAVTRDNIIDFLAGKQPKLPRAYRVNEKPPVGVDLYAPFLINGNGGNDTDFLYRSLLSKWNPSLPNIAPSMISSGKLFQVTGADLSTLYWYAYTGDYGPGSLFKWDSLFGKLYPSPLLEVNDSSQFKSDYGTGKNLYCYSISVPFKNNKERLMEMMQRDLKNYFGYEAKFETREMPCYNLVANDRARQVLPTKGGPDSINNIDDVSISVAPTTRHDGFILKNQPIQFLIGSLHYASGGLPIVNETGITGNIDIAVTALMTDYNDVNAALRKNGLELIRGNKKMLILVIKDNSKR